MNMSGCRTFSSHDLIMLQGQHVEVLGVFLQSPVPGDQLKLKTRQTWMQSKTHFLLSRAINCQKVFKIFNI